MSTMRYTDIAVNLTDDMFQGLYRGKQLHAPDLNNVLSRAKGKGVERMIITGTSLSETRQAIAMSRTHNLWCTAGCHPTSTSEIASHPGGVEAYMKELEAVIEEDLSSGASSSKIVAIGEIGLDYDRLYHSPKETQLLHFPPLLVLSTKYNLPLFLHSRHPEAHVDFCKILKEGGWIEGMIHEQGKRGKIGVVHSFTGTVEEMKELVSLGLYIGVNGCSLKTEENLSVVKEIPLDRLMLETDAPWCSITSTSAASKYLPPPTDLVSGAIGRVKAYKGEPDEKIGLKGRNEPSDITTVTYVVAKVMGKTVEEVSQAAWNNTMKVFFPMEVDK